MSKRNVANFLVGAVTAGIGLATARVDAQATSRNDPVRTGELKSESTGDVLEEVTVFGRRLGHLTGDTATKSGTPLMEIPFAVSTVSRDLLELRNVSNIGEAVETISGVSRTIGFSGNERFRIRGFQAIGYLRDGFRQSISQPEVDLQGVEAVEVLKGPASALYGRFEPGGVINFVSKRPGPEFGADVGVTAGSYGYGRIGIDVTGPMNGNQTLSGRLNVAYENSNSFRDFVDNEQLFIAPVFRYQLSPATDVLVRLEYLERDSAFDRGLGNDPAFLSVPVSRNYGERFMRLRKEQWTGAVEINRHINESWRFRIGAYISDVTVPEEEFFNYGFPPLTGTTVNRNFSSFNETQDDKTLQAEVYGDVRTGAVGHRLLIGIEHTDDKLAYLDGQAVFGAPPVDLFNPVQTGRPDTYVDTGNSNYEYVSDAIYLQDEISWNDWRLLLGGRYEEVETYTYSSGFVEPGVTRHDEPFSPRAGVTRLLTPDLSIYASWSRSFRNEGDGGLLESGLTPEPTRGEQIEVGAKVFLLDSRMELTVAAFDLSKTNAVVGDPDDFGRVIQTGKLVSRGAEVEMSARPLDSWTLVASYAYADAEITEDTNTLIVGNRLAGVPEHQASLWTSWAFNEGLLQGLTIGGGLFYGSRQAATTGNNFFLPGYTRIDLNAAYEFSEGYELKVNVDNVTNDRIYMTGGFSQVYPQAPRSARLTITKRWL